MQEISISIHSRSSFLGPTCPMSYRHRDTIACVVAHSAQLMANLREIDAVRLEGVGDGSDG